MQLEIQPTLSPRNATPARPQGLLFVLSAPSGGGKDTVIRKLQEQGMDFHVVVSVTTRAPRPGESEGHPYSFISQQAFEQLVANDELLEHANVHGNWYGQPIKPIRERLQAGQDVLLKIDVQGAATVRQKIPGAIFIFLMPGSVDELIERLNRRQTETEEQRLRRLQDAHNELAQSVYYDYTIENRQGQLDAAVERLRAVIMAEHCRTQPRYVDL
jgi:guanylate kinase